MTQHCTTRYLSKGYKYAASKGHMHSNVYSSTINNSQIMEEPKCPSTDEWIKKMWYIYTMEYYSVTKKNDILPFATTWMEQEGIMLSEVSQSEKDRYHMFSLICGIWGTKQKTIEEGKEK